MRLLELTLPSPAENLALDEALLLDAEDGAAGEVLRLWEYPRPVVVLGAGCRLRENVNEEACHADAVPILRRASGGDAPQDVPVRRHDLRQLRRAIATQHQREQQTAVSP